jgi:chitodextrinase
MQRKPLVFVILVFVFGLTSLFARETPPRPLGLTIIGKTDTSVALTWNVGTNEAADLVCEILGDDSLVGVSTSNSFLCTGLTQDHSYVFRVRARDAVGNASTKSNALLATPQRGIQQVQPLLVRTQFHALVLNYDVHIWANGGYVKASDYFRFRDVGRLTQEYIELLRRASGGQMVWSVADRYDLDEFAPSAVPSQGQFDSTNYLTLTAQGYNYNVSYDALIHDPRFGIVEKVNSGKVDAIWVFGMPNINFWETAMAGPNPYWVNGGPIWDSSLTRNMVIYGFGKAPHQGVGFMCENTCHMTENILGRISEHWPLTVATLVFRTLSLNDPNRILTNIVVNDWTHLTQAEAASWDPQLVAPGNAQAGLSHFPPTALYNYDWSTLNLDFSGTGPFQVIDGDWAIENGEYRVLAANSAKALAMDGINPEAFSDADVELTVRVMNDSYPSYAGLMFRLSACTPGNNQATGYYVGLNAWENRVVLARLQNQFIALTNAPYDVRTNFLHRLRMEARGSLIKVFLDGSLIPLITVTDDSYITGGFGFSAYFTDAYFDDLTVVPHVSSTADKWYRYPATSATAHDLTPLEWNGEGAPAMDGFYAWWWEHLPKNGGAHYATDLQNSSSALILNDWWPYVFDINSFTNTCPAPDIVFPPEDVLPPAPPLNAAALALGASKIGLSWSEPYDDTGVTRYEVFRDGALLRKTSVNYLIDTRLSPNTRYTYQITACDGSDNISTGVNIVATTLSSDFSGQILNSGFEFAPQVSEWRTDTFSPSAAQFTWEGPGAGRNGGHCVSIESSALNDASWMQTVSGLTPGETYWLTGWIRGQDIVCEQGRNIGANLCLEGTWSHAPDYLDGTFDWRQVSFSFLAPPSGTVTVGCRLGYWSNTTRGKAWFDDLAIVQPSELKFREARMLSDAWLRLSLFTPPGHRYRIEQSADLANWTQVRTFDAAHPLSEIEAPVSSAPISFYRAVRD